jgi:hypothetical protein
VDAAFDADRFGTWLEVLLESGVEVAAEKIAGMPADMVIAGLVHYIQVFDSAGVASYETTDGELIDINRAITKGLACPIGGYIVAAVRSDSWNAIVDILVTLSESHQEYFHRAMRGVRALSNSERELDGLDDLLDERDQAMFDVAFEREQRRDAQGYVTPAQARAFLTMSRAGRPAPSPFANPIARAYFHAIDVTVAVEPDQEDSSEETKAAIAGVVAVLVDEGVFPQAPRALLSGSHDAAPGLQRVRSHMQVVLERDVAAFSTRTGELAFLANTIMAGCSVQARAFTPQEASDAAAAICNLGLENWPEPLPEGWLVNHDLIAVFQVGWATLHANVVMFAATQLTELLTQLRCDDDAIQVALESLFTDLTRHLEAGEPWHASGGLDAIMKLDMPAWAALVGLIAECPVMHAGLTASLDPQARGFDANAFEFISDNSQIDTVREFLRSLPRLLSLG